jgi:hypothetical protein
LSLTAKLVGFVVMLALHKTSKVIELERLLLAPQNFPPWCLRTKWVAVVLVAVTVLMLVLVDPRREHDPELEARLLPW